MLIALAIYEYLRIFVYETFRIKRKGMAKKQLRSDSQVLDYGERSKDI